MLYNGELFIRTEEDAKKIQEELKKAGVKVEDRAVSRKTPYQERPSYISIENGDYLPLIIAKYDEFRIPDDYSTYERSEMEASYVPGVQGNQEMDVSAIKKTYSSDGIETRQDEARYKKEDKTFLNEDPRQTSFENIQNALHGALRSDVIRPIDYSFEFCDAMKGEKTTIARGPDLDELNVQYRKGTEVRNMEVLNRTDSDLADLTLDPYYKTALINGDEKILNSLDEDTKQRKFERQGICNGVSYESEQIMPKIKQSRYKEGLTKMAEKQGLIEPEQLEQ